MLSRVEGAEGFVLPSVTASPAPITPVFFQKIFANPAIYVYNCFNNLKVEANAVLFASAGLLTSYYLQKQEKKMKKLIFTLLCLFLAGSTYAATIIVKADGSGDYPTIQTAIGAANKGDTVEVWPGTYTGDGNRDIDFLGKAITVCSIDPNDPNIVAATIIDCNGTESEFHRGFNFRNNENANCIIAGLTITNGYASCGGGIRCYNSSPTIIKCVIKNNRVKGLFVEANGGGVHVHHGNPTFINCTFSNNCDFTQGEGGGMYCEYGSRPVLTGCIFNSNYASWSGGGVGSYASVMTLTNCTFTNNSTLYYGGGMCCNGHSLILTNCIFASNSKTSNIGNGGGLYLTGVKSILTNCTFVNNSGFPTGGGLGSYDCNPVLTNCIFWGNGYSFMSGLGTPDVKYSCIQGGWPGSGNIKSNPLLEPDGYHLNVGSPCINTGNPDHPVDANKSDIDGQPRIIGGRVDIGADEFHGNNSRPVADAGEDQIAYAWFDWLAEVILDGNGSYDDDGHVLTYLWRWSIDVNNFTAISPSPSIKLPTGEHVVELVVNDRVEDSEPDEVVITVVPPVQAGMRFTPQALNPSSKGRWVKAHLVLPEGFFVEDVNTNSPARIVEPFIADSNYMDVFINKDDLVEIMAAFDRAVFCSNGSMLEDIVVIARLTTGQYFYGTDTIRIKTNNLEYLAVLTSYWLEADCGEPDWCEGSDINQDGTVDFIDFAFFDGCCLEFIKK